MHMFLCVLRKRQSVLDLSVRASAQWTASYLADPTSASLQGPWNRGSNSLDNRLGGVTTTLFPLETSWPKPLVSPLAPLLSSFGNEWDTAHRHIYIIDSYLSVGVDFVFVLLLSTPSLQSSCLPQVRACLFNGVSHLLYIVCCQTM